MKLSQDLMKKLRYKAGPAADAPKGYRLGVETEGSGQGTFDFVQFFVNQQQGGQQS